MRNGSANQIAQLYEGENGLLVRAHRIEGIQKINTGKDQFWMLEFVRNQTMYVTYFWHAEQKPTLGGYFIFNHEYKTMPVSCASCVFMTEEEFLKDYKKIEERFVRSKTSVKSTSVTRKANSAPVYASAYESAIIQAENRIIDLVEEWDKDDGTKYPEELAPFLERLRRREL